MKQFRQGDVFFDIVKTDLPSNLKKKEDNLLLRGEGANHAHYVTSRGFQQDICVYENPDDLDELFIEIPEHVIDARIEHLLEGTGVWTQEHQEIVVAPGVYRITPHRQYNPYLKVLQRVQD